MFEVENTRLCDAPIGRVWRVVTDFDNYAEWHPAFSLVGAAEMGAKLKLSFRAAPGPLLTLNTEARVTRLQRPNEIGWQIGILGLLQIEHGFDLAKSGSGTHIRHWMRCRGLLSRVAAKAILGKMESNLGGVNASLTAFLRRATTIARYAPARGRSR